MEKHSLSDLIHAVQSQSFCGHVYTEFANYTAVYEDLIKLSLQFSFFMCVLCFQRQPLRFLFYRWTTEAQTTTIMCAVYCLVAKMTGYCRIDRQRTLFL